VIVHLVLFTPRADLGPEARAEVAHALDHALTAIPAIARFQVGRRVRLDTAYDRAAPIDFEYCVIVEFADRSALASYLAHPAHDTLGRLFYTTSQVALASDFDAVDQSVGETLERWVR
jgi:Stress responsive A/B Barrel Domain